MAKISRLNSLPSGATYQPGDTVILPSGREFVLNNSLQWIEKRPGLFYEDKGVLNSENLNIIINQGIYHQLQNVLATSANNYPALFAGTLEVFYGTDGSTAQIYQRYTILAGQAQEDAVYNRGCYAGVWSVWKKTLNTVEGGNLYLSKTYLSNKVINDANTVTEGTQTNYLNNSNKPVGSTDGSLFSLSHSSIWTAQQYSDWRTNDLFLRSQNQGTWGSWNKVWSDKYFSQADITSWKNLATNIGNYLPLSGGTMSGSINLGTASTIAFTRDLSTVVAGGISRDFFQIKAVNGVQDIFGHLGTMDASGNFTLTYGYLGGTAYNTKNALRWTSDQRVVVGASSTTQPTTGYTLDIIGAAYVRGDVAIAGSYDTYQGELGVKRQGVTRIRTNTASLILSGDTSTGIVYIRPQGDAIATSQILFNANNTSQYTDLHSIYIGNQTTTGSSLFHTNIATAAGGGYGLWMGQNLQFDGTNFIQPRGSSHSWGFTVNLHKRFSFNFAASTGTNSSVVSPIEVMSVDQNGLITTLNNGTSANWKAAYDTSLNAVTTNTVQSVNAIKTFTTLQKFNAGQKFFDDIVNLRKLENVKGVSNSVASLVSNIKVSFPFTMAAVMWSMKIKVIQYDGVTTNTKSKQAVMTITVTGYSSSAGAANINISARGEGFQNNFTGVRTGIDSTTNNKILWLDFSSGLAYPKAYIEEVIMHHANAGLGIYETGWNIEFSTDETNYTNQTTLLKTDFKELVTDESTLLWNNTAANFSALSPIAWKNSLITGLGVGTIPSLDAQLPNGGFINGYGTTTWGGSDTPTGASYGGYLKFANVSNNNNLDFYFNNGHNSVTNHRLWFRTKNSSNGVTNWLEVITNDSDQNITGLKTFNRNTPTTTGWGLSKLPSTGYGIVLNGGNGSNASTNQTTGIGFQYSGDGTVQAGIYVRNNGIEGTSMGFATTQGYSIGPQIGMTMSNIGVVDFARQLPTFQGLPLSTQNWVTTNFATQSYVNATFLDKSYLNNKLISDANSATTDGIMTNYLNGTNKPSGVNDGALLSLGFSNIWTSQLFADWRTTELYIRSQTNGTWSPTWNKFWSDKHFTDSDITNWNNKFKTLKSVADMNTVTESGIYRQETPLSGYNYTSTLNLNSSDGRQQLTIERGGGGMKFRGSNSSTSSAQVDWSDWRKVWSDIDFTQTDVTNWKNLVTNTGNFVPYTGATTNVNLGANSITSTGGFLGNSTSSTILQTARTLTIGSTGKTFNGSANVAWTLAEIGAAALSHTHTWAQITNTPTTASGYGITDVPRQAILGGDVNSVRVVDTRNTNPLPTTNLKAGVWFDFKANATIGFTTFGQTTYSGVMTVVPYSDDSGNNNAAFRLAQSNGVLGFQNYNGGAWDVWKKVWSTSDFTQTDVTNWKNIVTNSGTGYVTLNNLQTITGNKTFDAGLRGTRFEWYGSTTTPAGKVTTESIFFNLGSTHGYGISTNQIGGLDIMANQVNQPIRFWAGNDNDNPFHVIDFRKEYVRSFVPISLESGNTLNLKGPTDIAHYVKHFADDTDGFGVSTGFAVKQYNNESIEFGRIDNNGITTIGWFKQQSYDTNYLLTSGGVKSVIEFPSVPVTSGRNFTNGTLIKTSIDFPQTSFPFLLEIEGNSYGTKTTPEFLKLQGYIYDGASNGIVNVSASSLTTIVGGIKIFNVAGKLCFWFSSQGYWAGYNVKVTYNINGAVNSNNPVKNYVTSITDEAIPSSGLVVNVVPKKILTDEDGATQDWSNNKFAQKWENALAIGFQSGSSAQLPYIYHTDGTYAILATQSYVNQNFALRDGSNATNVWRNASHGLLNNPDNSSGQFSNSSGSSTLLDATFGNGAGIINTPGNGGPTSDWYHRLKMLHGNSNGYYTEIAVQMTSGNSMWYKRLEAGTTTGWIQLWDSQNLNVTNLLTTNTTQLVSGKKQFKNNGSNVYTSLALEAYSDIGFAPGIAFNKTGPGGSWAGSIKMTSSNAFWFWDNNGTTLVGNVAGFFQFNGGTLGTGFYGDETGFIGQNDDYVAVADYPNGYYYYANGAITVDITGNSGSNSTGNVAIGENAIPDHHYKLYVRGDTRTEGKTFSKDGFIHEGYADPKFLLTSDGGAIPKDEVGGRPYMVQMPVGGSYSLSNNSINIILYGNASGSTTNIYLPHPSNNPGQTIQIIKAGTSGTYAIYINGSLAFNQMNNKKFTFISTGSNYLFVDDLNQCQII